MNSNEQMGGDEDTTQDVLGVSAIESAEKSLSNARANNVEISQMYGIGDKTQATTSYFDSKLG